MATTQTLPRELFSAQTALDATIERLVAAAPPLTDSQVRRLNSLLGDLPDAALKAA